jgi:hypothetical protein
MLDIQELLLSFEGDETVGASQGDIRFFHHVKRKERKIEKKRKKKWGTRVVVKEYERYNHHERARYHAFDLDV